MRSSGVQAPEKSVAPKHFVWIRSSHCLPFSIRAKKASPGRLTSNRSFREFKACADLAEIASFLVQSHLSLMLVSISLLEW